MKKHILLAGNTKQCIPDAGEMLKEAIVAAGWNADGVEEKRQDDVTCYLLTFGNNALRAGAKEQALADVGLVASLAAADAFEGEIRPGGLLVMNATAIRRPTLRRDADVVMVPVATTTDPMMATLTLLGALVALTGWVRVSAMSQVVRKTCKEKNAAAAFRRGVRFVDALLASALSQAA